MLLSDFSKYDNLPCVKNKSIWLSDSVIYMFLQYNLKLRRLNVIYRVNFQLSCQQRHFLLNLKNPSETF